MGTTPGFDVAIAGVGIGSAPHRRARQDLQAEIEAIVTSSRLDASVPLATDSI